MAGTMKRQLLVALLTALLSVGTAQASLIRFAFTGVIDNDTNGVFDSATFAGSYTFDSTMPQVLTTPNSGGYAGSGGIFNMNVAFTGTLDPSVAGPYIADTLNLRVRKVSASGTISTVAGNGKFRIAPENSMAVNAFLLQPEDVAMEISTTAAS